jgi:hypothetical protein
LSNSQACNPPSRLYNLKVGISMVAEMKNHSHPEASAKRLERRRRADPYGFEGIPAATSGLDLVEDTEKSNSTRSHRV